VSTSPLLDKNGTPIVFTVTGIYDQGVGVGFGAKGVALNAAGFAPLDKGDSGDELVATDRAP
jgi:hypothetical protein